MVHRLVGKCLAIGGLLILVTASTLADDDTLAAKHFDILDGNRLNVAGRQIRLTGIVAPELGQSCTIKGKALDCGLIARAALADLTAGSKLLCSKVTDTALAPTYRCTAGGYDLSEGMVYTGWAVPLSGAPAVYHRVLADAIERQRGFWKGSFRQPWPLHDAYLKQ